jgi:hypothetical protein
MCVMLLGWGGVCRVISREIWGTERYVSALRVVTMPYPMLMSRFYFILHYSFVVMLITAVLCNVVGSLATLLCIQKQAVLQCCVDHANYFCYFPWELENGYVLIHRETSYFTTLVLIMPDYIYII